MEAAGVGPRHGPTDSSSADAGETGVLAAVMRDETLAGFVQQQPQASRPSNPGKKPVGSRGRAPAHRPAGVLRREAERHCRSGARGASRVEQLRGDEGASVVAGDSGDHPARWDERTSSASTLKERDSRRVSFAECAAAPAGRYAVRRPIA